MNVEIGSVAAQFLFWEYLLRIFGIGSLQCICPLDSSSWSPAKLPRERLPALSLLASLEYRVVAFDQDSCSVLYCILCPFALLYITYLIDSCPISKSTTFFSWAGQSAYAVHKVISPLPYVPHNGPALPEKSAKIEICQQSKLSVCASSAVYPPIQWTFNL